MSATRTRCHRCGFEVVAEDECPLCGRELTERFPRATLANLFGD